VDRFDGTVEIELQVVNWLKHLLHEIQETVRVHRDVTGSLAAERI
jgi:hypothetical protein